MKSQQYNKKQSTEFFFCQECMKLGLEIIWKWGGQYGKTFPPFFQIFICKDYPLFTIIAPKRNLGMYREEKIISISYPVLLTTNVYVIKQNM